MCQTVMNPFKAIDNASNSDRASYLRSTIVSFVTRVADRFYTHTRSSQGTDAVKSRVLRGTESIVNLVTCHRFVHFW